VKKLCGHRVEQHSRVVVLA